MGGKVALAHYQFQLASVTPVQGPNYTGQQAQVIVTHEGKQVAVLYPQQRYFPVAEVEVAKTAIDAKVFRDLYVALGDKPAHTLMACASILSLLCVGFG